MLNKMTLLVFTALLPLSAWSQSYQLGQAAYSGSGCPPGTAAVVLSPNGSEISVLFDQFSLQQDATVNRSVATCDIEVPMTVTPGYLVETTYVDYRGFANIPNRNAVTLYTTGFSNTNRMSPRFSAQSMVVGPIQDSVYFRQRVAQTMPGNRKCPATQSLRLNIRAQMNGRMFGGEFTLDTADVGAQGLTMGITLKPCRL